MTGLIAGLAARASSLSTPEKWVVDWFAGGASSATGVSVNGTTAMEWGPFFAGVRNISDDIGSLPFPVYERLNEQDRRRARDHPLYSVLNVQANPLMGAMQLRSTLQAHAMTWHGGAAYIESDGRGRVVGLWPLRPDRLHPETASLPGHAGRLGLRYLYDDPVNNIRAALLPDEVLYVPGLSFNGIRGYSLIHQARETIGLGLATEKHGGTFFGNGARPGGVLKHPGTVTDGARERIRSDWEQLHKGLDRSQRIAILEEGVDYESIGIPNGDAQFLETRQFEVVEAARWLRLQPHKLQEMSNATFSNIEHQSIEYIVDTLRPWCVRWEQAALMRLFTPRERATLFSEHVLEALLRGDIKTRYEAYAIGRQWGWESSNTVLAKENRNSIGPQGDVYLAPLNMVPLDQFAGDAGDVGRVARLGTRSVIGRKRLGDAFAPKLQAADLELAETERDDVDQLVEDHLEDDRAEASVTRFIAAVEEYYQGTVRERTTAAWLPILSVAAAEAATSAAEDVGHDEDVDLERWVAAYVATHVGYRIASSIGQLDAAARADEPAEAVRELMGGWVDERPSRFARWHKVQLINAAAREAWKEAGIRRTTWVTTGDSDCPWCSRLDGQTVGIETPYLQSGDVLSDDDDQELQVKHDTFHPPAHPGCDCSISAA